MAQGRRSTGPGGLGPEALMVFIGLGAFAVIVGGVWSSLAIAAKIDGTESPGGNPFAALFNLISGDISWTGTATAVLIGEIAVVALAGLLVLIGVRRMTSRSSRVDKIADQMATSRRDLAKLTREGAQSTANRLGAGHAGPGVYIGKTVVGDIDLFGSWEDMHIDIWGPRTGKAVPSTTPVLTPHGWVPIKDLARGCRVIGADGQPTVVTGVYPQGVRPAYRMHLSDGTSIACDADHLWTVRPKIRADKKNPLAWRTWTTRQLLERGLTRMGGGAKYYLPIVAPVAFEGVLEPGRPTLPAPPDGRGRNLVPAVASDSMPVDPYVLGVLIGDGSLRSGSIRLSTAEAQDLLPLMAPGIPAGVVAKPVSGSRYDWALTSGRRGPRNELMAGLRELGLMGHSSLTKFVPPAYLLADVETRRALLAGLLDTDGSIDEKGIVEFSTSSPQLSEDFRFLVQSLGGTVTTTRRETMHAPSYRSNVRLPIDGHAPFRLPRKLRRWEESAPKRRSATPVRAIRAIEPEGATEMVCISVAAPDGLFVTDEFIVTHNTTTRAVPAILDAPGAVIATSNKRDIVDATRGPRSAKGPVWVFDPQGVCDEEPTWWWNPLSYVTDEVKARQFADHIVASQRKEGARTDAYFDVMATDLLALLTLAAALGNKPLSQVYLWLTDQLNDEPARILASNPGYELPAQQMQSILSLPEKQRAGVYGTAQPMVQFMINRQVARWVNPQGENDTRPQFNQEHFVRQGGTLYSLSKEGIGTAGPLVAALTVAIVEAAEEFAKTCPNGRLTTPMVGVLDEAANVCRWKDLPDLYSHFGSRGIVLMTILQSWAQGIECWGEHGIEKLWSAANIRVYGGGVSDSTFLERLSKLIGDYDISSRSVTYGKGERSHSSQIQRHNIMEVSDLTSMPAGRAVVFASGTPATMIRTVPWMVRPDADQVRASFARYDPGASPARAVTTGTGANAWVAAGRNAQVAGPQSQPQRPSGPPQYQPSGPPQANPQQWGPPQPNAPQWGAPDPNQRWAPPNPGQRVPPRNPPPDNQQ